jgi:uncharacterized membrane protein HdeD (DUF308 family)
LDTSLLRTLGRAWWLVLLRGVLAIGFGLMAWVWPKLTLFVLVTIWGAYALVDGVVALVAGFRMRTESGPLWSVIFVGLLGTGAGATALLWPGMTALVLLMFIGAWAIAIGTFQIITAVRLRREIDNEWMMGVAGGLLVLLGVLLFVNPGAGWVTLVWVIGGFSIAFGVLLMMLALRLRAHAPGGIGANG